MHEDRSCLFCEHSPGILYGGGPEVERCDECAKYEGDLDAAYALMKARVPGGSVRFYQHTGAWEPFGPDPWQRPVFEVRTYTPPGRTDDCVASGTDPWIVDARGEIVVWGQVAVEASP